MASSINTNIMAQNTARTLNSHYARLSTSVARLSSGLRINSSADDAAGLAIRELMRADVAALNQGARNANDAISMLQVADGALAIIDEKLIRMKELAEQAATGTYNSTQRLMIQSEYQAMADEIDRIARATDFNGIHLLDGSLSGAHNGTGLNSTGAMKIHFGAGNDSAEDYYYISIGDCTAAALGLGKNALNSGTTITRVPVETFVQEQLVFKPQTSYVEYTDPNTGNKYYSDGNNYFGDVDKPGSTMLDWVADREIIERLRMEQATRKSVVYYNVYEDPDTGLEYFSSNYKRTVLTDANNPDSLLDNNNAAHKAIIDRLVSVNKRVGISTNWLQFKNPTGGSYYSCDNGQTYVSNITSPNLIALDSNNPAHKDRIDALTPAMTEKKITLPTVYVDYVLYRSKNPSNNQTYYSSDGGKTFVTSGSRPDETMLDPVKDRDLIASLEPIPDTSYYGVPYDTYYYIDTVLNKYQFFYTRDDGQTFIRDVNNPSDIALRADNPADASEIARLKPYVYTVEGRATFDVYEDRANGNTRYYSGDGGLTFFSNPSSPWGSVLDVNDPGYSALVANFEKIDSVLEFSRIYDRYKVGGSSYYTCDGGQTFVGNPNKPMETALDPSNPAHLNLINQLKPDIIQTRYTITYEEFRDPVTNTIYYTPFDDPGKIFLTNPNPSGNVALDIANQSDRPIIDRLVPVEKTARYAFSKSFPDKYLIYVDSTTGTSYYSADEGTTFFRRATMPYGTTLKPDDPRDRDIIDRLQPQTELVKKTVYIEQATRGGPGDGFSISTQAAAQKALVAIDRAIASKDTIRAHLGAMQNRLENTVTNLTIQAENLQSAESRISDTDVALEMTQFVRNQILTQSAVAMLGQANSFPHMLMTLLG